MEIRNVLTTKAPVPSGHYSQAVTCNNLIFISGQLPVNSENGGKILGTIEEQTLQVLKNIKAIVEEAGSDLSRIVNIKVYIKNIEDWENVNDVYKSFFRSVKPSRTIVPVKNLHYGFRIEMDAIAVI